MAETQRQLKKVGLEGALIRVFKQSNESFGIGTDRNFEEELTFTIQIDPTVNKLNIQKIRDICPTGVFTIQEEEEDGGLVS